MSEQPLSWSMRVVRGGVIAAVATTFGTLAHTSSGGLLPGPGWLAVVAVTMAAVTVPASGQPASRPRLIALVAGGQLVVHAALTVLPGHRAASPPAISSSGPHWTDHVLTDITGPHALMALAHLAGAALVAWWLAGGERTFWALIALAGVGISYVIPHWVRWSHRVPLPTRRTTVSWALAASRSPRLVDPMLGGALVTRGPPAVSTSP